MMTRIVMLIGLVLMGVGCSHYPASVYQDARSSKTQTYIDQPYAQSEAQLRDLRSAEARVRLARTIVDFDKNADADDVRELLTAREDLRRLRSENPTLETESDPAYHPFGLPGYFSRGGWTNGVLGMDGNAVPAGNYMQTPLSGLP